MSKPDSDVLHSTTKASTNTGSCSTGAALRVRWSTWNVASAYVDHQNASLRRKLDRGGNGTIVSNEPYVVVGHA
jgi:hypothetical protein